MAPTASGDLSTSEEARQHGDELYRKGDLSGAETSYKLAAKLAPNDPSPLSNLSSVKFEQGQYSAAAAYIHEALELSEAFPLDEAAKRKRELLYLRLAKCHAHEGKFAEAEEAAQQLSDQQSSASLKSGLGAVNAWRTSEVSKDKTAHWRKVLDRLPRYKAHLENAAEYYAIGHDTAESLADKELLGSSSPQDSLSLMFYGSGDARHVFSTFLRLAFNERKAKKKQFKGIHLTVLDLKPAAIGRTLLLLEMCCTYQMLRTQKVPGYEDLPTIMAYIYATPIISAAVNEKIRQHIEATRKQVVYVLRQWQIPMADQVPYLRTKIVRRTSLSAATPGIVPLMEAYEEAAPDAAKKLGVYIDENRVTNPTLVDLDFTRATEGQRENDVPNFEEDPLYLATSLIPSTNESALQTIATFFDVVALSLILLSKRMKVEALVGEMSEVMERIRWSCLDSRAHPCGVSNLRFTVLLNPPMFEDHADFQSKYFLMHQDKQLTDHFALKRRPRDDGAPDDGSDPFSMMMGMMGMMGMPGGATGFVTEGYIVWDQVPARKLLPKQGLLPRAHLYSPLNLAAFMRLVAHLSSIGYPSHWLSAVLEALCSGEITTTARAPRQVTADKFDVDDPHPATKMTVAPWRADFTTTLGVWSRLLPFGFVVPPASIPGPDEVGEYSVTFPPLRADADDYLRSPHFVLVFWDSRKGGASKAGRKGILRKILLNDETGFQMKEAAEKRKTGIHVFSSLHYDSDTETARWWCHMDAMKSLIDDVYSECEVFIWRADSWEQVTEGVAANTGVSFLGPWTRGDA
ncbi:tetratricopeptide [Podospora australis]|uniref:Tetratricopeptide n=1 Tax=Podospora australis TaxID=1536484 RepID=A0AAN6WR08_9PEZI|nr:tetratricopeptide [Podospora australis]